MPRSFVYLIYNLLLPLVLIIGLPSFLIKGIRRGGLARNFRQRLGCFRSATFEKWAGSRPVWIHAVSVGEVFIAFKLIRELQSLSPEQHIVLSVTTTTGFALAAEKESETLTVIHNPVDLPLVTSGVIRKINPSKLVLVEAEVWPNLVRQLTRKEIPVLLINARLSPRSEARYLKFRRFIEPVFSLIKGATVPYEVDQARWAALGIQANRISVTGSIKFDDLDVSGSNQQQVEDLRQWLKQTGLPDKSRILLAGSTHPGEELLIAEVVSELQQQFPDLALVIVPRHAERGREIADSLNSKQWSPVLKVPGKGAPSDLETRGSTVQKIWIANTTGELRSWYQLADAVVIGKSFLSKGGQNPVEPVLAGKPTVVGPHMENFTDVVNDLLKVDGIHRVTDAVALTLKLTEILHHPDTARRMASKGIEAMERHRGATAKNAEFILKFAESEAGQSETHPPT